MTDWGRQPCSQISQLTKSIRALLNRLAVRLEKEVQPASLRTGRTSFHSSRLTSLLSIAACTLPCKHTQSQLSRTGISASVRRLFAPTQGSVLTVATPSDITFCRVKSWLSHFMFRRRRLDFRSS